MFEAFLYISYSRGVFPLFFTKFWEASVFQITSIFEEFPEFVRPLPILKNLLNSLYSGGVSENSIFMRLRGMSTVKGFVGGVGGHLSV